tara:strand:+ start:936 stop:1367 length:432 start_codon:yes stop_codon:yes gene_type:complete
MANDCKEYNSLNYKTMMHTGRSLNQSKPTQSEEDLNDFLNEEMNTQKKSPWSKLTKTCKLKKIKNYVKKQNDQLNEEELNQSSKTILKLLDRKKLSKQTELIYNKEDEHIESIQCILFDNKSRTYKMIPDKATTLKKKNSLTE